MVGNFENKVIARERAADVMLTERRRPTDSGIVERVQIFFGGGA